MWQDSGVEPSLIPSTPMQALDDIPTSKRSLLPILRTQAAGFTPVVG
jgi:hypothetical protein